MHAISFSPHHLDHKQVQQSISQGLSKTACNHPDSPTSSLPRHTQPACTIHSLVNVTQTRSRLVATRLGLNLSLSSSIEGLELGSSKAQDTILLVVSKPGLLGIAENATGDKVDELTNDDEHESNRVQEVNLVAKNAGADDDTPEVGSQKRDVEESRATHSQHDRNQRIEQVHAQRKTNNPADNVAVPGGVIEGLSVKDGSLDSVDAHAKETQEGQDMVQMRLGHEPLLKDIGSTVERGAKQSKEITLDHIKTLAAVGTRDVVAANQNTHATAADEDTHDLEDSVADLEQEERDDDDANNGPEVDELGGEDVGVAVGQDSKVVALDIEERHDEVLPAISPGDSNPLARTILEQEDGGVDEEHEDVVEDGLEGGNVGALLGEETCKGVGRRDAQG